MKILITGAGGFIGSHLTERCTEKGYQVRCLIRYNSRNNLGWLENSSYRDEIEIIMGDIRDYDSVKRAITGCDTVFHLAALISIPYSYVSPIAYIETNIIGAYNILEASRESEIKNILITSTSETYGSAQYSPIDENHPMVGQSPYSASKIGADQLAISYFRSFNLPIKIVRPFNTYGPRQSGRAVIPTIVGQILADEEKIKLGNLSPTRDLTFVKDTVNGFLEIAKSDKLYGEIVNIGMNEEISIGDLKSLIGKIMSVDVKIVRDSERVRPSTSEVKRLRCNNAKILSHTDWKPKYNIEKGLTETIDWMRKNLNYYKAEIYNI